MARLWARSTGSHLVNPYIIFFIIDKVNYFYALKQSFKYA